jgi:hypothetical protein
LFHGGLVSQAKAHEPAPDGAVRDRAGGTCRQGPSFPRFPNLAVDATATVAGTRGGHQQDRGAAGVHGFIERVVPRLQDRGLFRRDYIGSTLREHLGLPIPG